VSYLGHLDGMVHVGDEYLARILLVAGKKTITKNWLKSDTPSNKQWMSIIKDILSMELLTYKLKMKEDVFIKSCGKCLTYKGRHVDSNIY